MHVYDWTSMQSQAVTELYRRTVAQGEQMSVAWLEVAQGASARPTPMNTKKSSFC
jgi:hypothetical protein